ncbi:MAG: acyl-CoA reductase [Flavobacteriales bacterium]
MASIENKVNTLAKLGSLFGHLSNSNPWPGYECGVNETEYSSGLEAITAAVHHNGWFTAESVRKALKAWSEELTETKLNNWLSRYSTNNNSSSTVAIIAAGNIPLVGLHDLISVLVSGNKALLKVSSKDTVLMLMAVNYLKLLDEHLGNSITVNHGKLSEFDAVIATGSNNSARYFDYYFKNKPSIIRKNRTSVAILTGSESESELHGLAEDIFTYYGLGCRNVTKLYLPQAYDLDKVFRALYAFKDIANHNKYANNYDYHRAIWLMNNVDLVENGFILLKQDSSLVSPVGSLFYDYYQDEKTLRDELNTQKDEIQCVVSSNDIPFGQAQKPGLSDYADGVDVLEFLLALP